MKLQISLILSLLFLSTSLSFAGKYSFEDEGYSQEEVISEVERLPASRTERKDEQEKNLDDFDDFDKPKKVKRKKRRRRGPASVSKKSKTCMVYKKVMNGKSTTVVELITRSRRPSSKSKCITYRKKKNGKRVRIIELVE